MTRDRLSAKTFMIESKTIQEMTPLAPHTDDDLGFNLMREAFAQAKRAHSRAFRRLSYVLGGQGVQIRIVGQKLAEFMDLPFAHLRADSHLPISSLAIELWDQVETGVSCQIGLSRGDLDLHPDLRRSPDGRYASYQLQHSLVCLDRVSGLMIGWVSNAAELSLYERGRPLHVPLSLWHKNHGMPLMHAGLVSKHGRGLLLVGPGGSGKSTSAIMCAYAGFDYLSDDLVGLELSADGGFIGHSLYNSTFMEPNHLKQFNQLDRHAIRGKYSFEKKHLVLLSQIASLRFARNCRIHAIVLPRVLHRPTSVLRRASRPEALMALAPSSLLMGERSYGLQGFEKLSQLVEQVPCYRLELGGTLEEIPRVLEGLLSEVRPGET
jgi:hypothetical protein